MSSDKTRHTTFSVCQESAENRAFRGKSRCKGDVGGRYTTVHPSSPFVYDAVNTGGLLEVVAVCLCHGGEEGGEREAWVAVPFILTRAAHH